HRIEIRRDRPQATASAGSEGSALHLVGTGRAMRVHSPSQHRQTPPRLLFNRVHTPPAPLSTSRIMAIRRAIKMAFVSATILQQGDSANSQIFPRLFTRRRRTYD